MANSSQNDKTADRRAEARKAMEDEKHRDLKKKREEEKQKRRQEAVHAMEGEELRKRREMREQLVARRLTERETASQEKQAAAEAEKQAVETAEKSAAKEAEVAEAVYQKRVDKIKSSKQTIEKIRDEKTEISPIRTYKSDVARAVREEGVSLSTIAMSEQTRKHLGLGPTDKPSPRNNSLFYLLLVLILIIIGGGLFLWWRGNKIIPTPTNPDVITPASTEFIFADAHKNIELASTAANTRAAINQEAKNANGSWTIENLLFTQDDVAISWPRVAQTFDLKIPDPLARGLGTTYMFGLYRTSNTNQRFLLLKTSLSDKAFASLLSWEPVMPERLLPLFYETSPKISNTAFQDKLVRNKDTRVLVTSSKQTVLLYALIDDQTIVVAPNEETFTAILDRFANIQGI